MSNVPFDNSVYQIRLEPPASVRIANFHRGHDSLGNMLPYGIALEVTKHGQKDLIAWLRLTLETIEQMEEKYADPEPPAPPPEVPRPNRFDRSNAGQPVAHAAPPPSSGSPLPASPGALKGAPDGGIVRPVVTRYVPPVIHQKQPDTAPALETSEVTPGGEPKEST